MALRSDWSTKTCPIARSLDVIGDPWVMLIIREAFVGRRRFEQFRSTLGIADNVLTRRLITMVDAGLLVRVPYRAEQRVHHEYALTEAGVDLLPVVNSLILWGEKHTANPLPDGHLAILHVDCPAETAQNRAGVGLVESEAAESCSQCGEPLTAGSVAWDRSWVDDEPRLLAGPQG